MRQFDFAKLVSERKRTF